MASVLVVDDRAENRAYLATLLRYTGHRVLEAANGSEALTLARRELPRLIITDLLMPEMDGFELARLCREDPVLQATRIVFYTATYVASDARALAEACGVKHILTKPAEPDEVLRTVAAALEEDEAQPPDEAPPPDASNRSIFDQAHLRLLNMTLAHKAEVVVPRLNAVMRLSLEMSSQLEPVRLLQTFCEGLTRALDGTCAIVTLVRRVHQEDGTLFTSGLDPASPLAGWEPRGAALEAMDRRQPLAVSAGAGDLGLPSALQGSGAFVVAPVQSPQSVYGCVLVARTAPGSGFDEDETDLVGILGGLVGRIYENGSLYAAARRQAEQLASSEQRFRELAENIPEVFWVCTVDDPVEALYVSPAYESVWGRPVETFYQRPSSWLDAVVPEDVAVASTFMERSRQGAIAAEEFRILSADGGIRWLWARSFPLKDDGGRIERVAGVTLDITDRRTLDQQFRQAQKMEAVGRLAGGVAHDFNNLIGVVMGFGESARRLIPDGHAARPKIDQILRAADRAASVTRQLLLFSRKHVAEPRVLDLNDVVRDMEGMLQRLIGEDVELSVEYGSRGAVRADVREIEQVLMNLAVNARDAMPDGGHVRIATADCTKEAGGAGPAIPAGDYVRLTVSDDGVGIAPEIQPHVFEPFFTTKPPDRGTGLGLSTVYGIVAQVRGHVLLASELGHGATFSIYLPRTQSSEVPARTENAPLATGSETVLLVEDDPALRSVTREMLEECGYSVLEAANGIAAEEVTRTYVGPLDLLVTDVVMPGLNGVETARRVVALRPDIKVLFVSGYAALDMTPTDLSERILLQKPYTITEMARKVREALGA